MRRSCCLSSISPARKDPWQSPATIAAPVRLPFRMRALRGLLVARLPAALEPDGCCCGDARRYARLSRFCAIFSCVDRCRCCCCSGTANACRRSGWCFPVRLAAKLQTRLSGQRFEYQAPTRARLPTARTARLRCLGAGIPEFASQTVSYKRFGISPRHWRSTTENCEGLSCC